MYVDGFLLVVPKKNLATYRKMATVAGKVWRKYGALDYKECLGDDMRPKGVKQTFGKVLKLKPSELAVFSYIVYRSKADRNRINKLVMKDPMMNNTSFKDMPFDMARMCFAGFKVLVDAKR